MRRYSILGALLTLAAGCGSAQPPVESGDEQFPEPNIVREAEAPILDSTAVCIDTGAPAAAVAGQINSQTVEFEVPGGVPVILKQTPGNPVVAVRLFIVGGSRNLTPASQGVESLALEVATGGGTDSLSKAELSARLNAMGSGIGHGEDLDYSTIDLSTLAVYLDDSWALYRDVLLNASFPEAEVALARERQVQSIRMRDEDPDTRVVDVVRTVFFEGHTYANRPIGTVEVVGALDREGLMAHYRSLFDPARMLLVIVGDLDQARATALVGDTFAGFTASGVTPIAVPALQFQAPAATIVEAPLPTNYILGLAPAPAPSAPDYAPLLLAVDHLGDRLFEEVRTIRNLSYAVSAGLSTRLANYTSLYVTAVDPAATLPVMHAEVERLQTQPLTQEQVRQIVAGYITRYYQGIDSNMSLATELGFWELFGGGREQADALIQRLHQVTPDDIQRVAREYLENYQFAVLGPGPVTSELFDAFDGVSP